MENRVIKFRGMNTDGEWVYGFLFELSFDGYSITCIGTEPLSANDYSEIYKSCYEEVIPETVGQFTGLKDLHGEEIYEGDIVSAWSRGWNAIGEVKCRIDGLWFMYPAWQHKIMWGLCPQPDGQTRVEVIGNIYENPELIQEAQP